MKGALTLALLVVVGVVFVGSTPSYAQEKRGDEEPFAIITRSWGPPIPVYRSDLEKEIAAVDQRVDHLSEQLKDIRVPKDKDEIEKRIPGALSLARHNQDIGELRDQFTKCVAMMQNRLEEKLDSGTTTSSDKAQFEKSLSHCQNVLSKMNGMHFNTSRLSTATRSQYILDGWEKHEKSMGELKGLMAQCPALMKDTTERCEMTEGK